MPSRRVIDLIVIHCSASKNGVALGTPLRTAAQIIDGWHKVRGFSRQPSWRLQWNQPLAAIGYHFLLDIDGAQFSGRHLDEIGAHVAGHNARSIGICCVGYDALTLAQWSKLRTLITTLQSNYPAARVVGHRDLSPDLNGDGKITPNEYSKLCPGFSVADWIAAGMQPLPKHTVAGAA